MAHDEDTPMRTEEESDSGSGSGSESEEEGTELLVNTREKRSTAGNRLTSLIQQEADDDLELLFEEAEDDAEFDDVDADSDVHMDSSDDDDDQGPAAGAEDFEGEKELQKQARAEKIARRKKAGDGIPKVFKRVKIDTTASQTQGQVPAPRPKKKSERASWIPTADDAPTRASKRKSTKQSKEQLMAQMVDREIKRVKQLETMEKAQAAKAAAKRPAMTQADRLAEAARVEKKNAKSLSRWEEAEQQREEEQLAKLAALSNRQLNGPVITWWSGMGTWVGGVLKRVGKTLELEDPKEKQSRKRKAAEMEAELAAAAAAPAPAIDQDQVMQDTPVDVPVQPTTNGEPNGSTSAPLPPTQPASTPQPPTRTPPQSSPPTDIQPPIEPIQTPVSLDVPPPSAPLTSSAPPSTKISPANASSSPVPPSMATPPTNIPKPAHPPFILAPPQLYQPLPTLDGSSPLPGFGLPQLSRPMLSQTSPLALTPQTQINQLPPPPPPGPPKTEHAALNYVILSNFDEEAIKDKGVQTTILMGRKFVKYPRNKRDHELCAITGSKAAFRDPVTGLPYGNSHAYKEIQKLKRGEYRWSKLVGAYVGQGNYAARGVPPRFVNPKAPKIPVPSPLMAPPTPQSVARAS